jgi:hypothetical protein
MDFEKITNQELDEIDLKKLSKKITNDEHRGYFIGKSSKEHYRFLSYLSDNNDGINFLDVGTFKGASALALSKNKNNFVYSFDLSSQLNLKKQPKNVEFFLDYVTNTKYEKLVLSCKYILLDTLHDGEFEDEFFNFLKKIRYKGYLILDDIKLNSAMIKFWDNIDLPKKDISYLGHATGTGIVFFE